MTDSLKYPRRAKRTIGDQTYNIYKPTDKRSKIMKSIGSKNTKGEKLLQRALWRRGIRYWKNVKKLPGKPDLLILKSKIVIFVDGEFWHGYKWSKNKDKIKSNSDFWKAKIESNIRRDKENNRKLYELGYRVIRIWEKDLLNNLERTVNRIVIILESPKIT